MCSSPDSLSVDWRTQAETLVGQLFSHLQTDMNALLQRHVSHLQQDCDQALSQHFRRFEEILQQQHPQASDEQKVVRIQETESRSKVDLTEPAPAKSRVPFELPISTLQVAMLKESIAIGKAEAEEAALGAGFMGGGGPAMQASWAILGVVSIFYGLHIIDDSQLGAEGAARIVTSLLSSFGVVTFGCSLVARSYFLYSCCSRAAYLTLVSGFALLSCGYVSWMSVNICLTISRKCSWRADDYVFLEAGESCVPLSLISDLFRLLQGIFSARLSWLMCYRRRDDAAKMFIVIVTTNIPQHLYMLIVNAAMGLPNLFQAVLSSGILAGMLFFLPFLIYVRRSMSRRAWLIVRADAEKYEGQWHDATESHGEVLGDIAALANALNMDIQAHVKDLWISKAAPQRVKTAIADDIKSFNSKVRWLVGQPVQCIPAAVPEMNDCIESPAKTLVQALLALGIQCCGKCLAHQYIDSLPLLFAQAHSLNGHFQNKCADWATGIGEHKYVGVKRQKRAIQKLWRTYNGNVRLLTDLVRSSIICEKLSQILAVLRRIRTDPAVGILRVKNRFDPRFDSSISGGYRNLSLNLIVVDDHTSQACTASHICELQLSWKAFDSLKTDGGHKRYVRFRDMRAE